MSSSSRSCVRCLKPVLEESASGLCAQCERETSKESGTPASANPDQTRSQAPGEFGPTLTAGFQLQNDVPKVSRVAPPGYDLYRHLGGGGMGDVYLAQEHAAQRVLAVKFLRHNAGATTQDRFLKEVRALGRIDHPNVVRIVSVELDRPEPYYSMEYGPGGTLADRIKAEGRLDPKDAGRLCLQLAEAMSVVHEAEILHRDIKPSNVVFGADGQPKISDFGLAKLMDEDDGLTRTTQAIGTPAFMPPEQISRKLGDLGPATDVYGLGATLYCMLTGKPPFDGDSNEDIISKVRTDEPVWPSKLRPDLPKKLDAIVLKCLEKWPADRYASSDELAKDLARYLEGKVAPIAPEMTWGRRAKKWVRREQWRLVGGLAVCALVFAALIGGMYLSDPSPPKSEPDSWKAIQEEWTAGKPVLQLGEEGKPRWYRWVMGAPEFGRSLTGDGSCTFEVSGFGLLELCPKPTTEHYTLRAKIRFAQSKITGGAVDGTTSAGLYFGHSEHRAAGGQIVHPMFAVTFNDYPVKSVNPKGVQLRSAAIVQSKDSAAYGPTTGIASKMYTPANTLPGPWRSIAIEVSPQRVVANWEDEGKMIPFANLPAATIRAKYSDLEAKLAGNLGQNHGVKVPEWNPKLPFGIWCYRASIDLKDVIIEPQTDKE